MTRIWEPVGYPMALTGSQNPRRGLQNVGFLSPPWEECPERALESVCLWGEDKARRVI